MTVADATPDLEHIDQSDRAFLGHPKGLGYLSFVEACERFSYYSMQTLLTLYMVNYLLVPHGWTACWASIGCSRGIIRGSRTAARVGDLRRLHLAGLSDPDPRRDHRGRFAGRHAALLAGGLMMSLGHFLMAFEGAFLFALLALIIGVGLFKGNIASQVGALYKENDLRRAMAFQIFYIAINVSVIAAPLVCGTLGEKVGWHYGFGTAGIVMVLGVLIYLKGRPHLASRRARRIASYDEQDALAHWLSAPSARSS